MPFLLRSRRPSTISWAWVAVVCAENPTSMVTYASFSNEFMRLFLIYTLFPVPVGPQNSMGNSFLMVEDEQVGVAHRVRGLHDDFVRLGLVGDGLVRVDLLDPEHPLSLGLLLHLVDVVEHGPAFGQRNLLPLNIRGERYLPVQEALQENVEGLPGLGGQAASGRPNEREHEAHVQNLGPALGLHVLQLRVLQILDQRPVHAHKRDHNVRGLHWRDGFALPPDLLERGVDQPGEQKVDFGLVVVLEAGGELVLPAFEERDPADRTRLHLDHAAARHGGRGGGLQVHGLEDHVPGLGHRDDLARVQAELAVVVEHGVHVLDPDRVDGAVEVQPLAVLVLGLGEVAELDRQHAGRTTRAKSRRCTLVNIIYRDLPHPYIQHTLVNIIYF